MYLFQSANQCRRVTPRRDGLWDAPLGEFLPTLALALALALTVTVTLALTATLTVTVTLALTATLALNLTLARTPTGTPTRRELLPTRRPPGSARPYP